MGELGAAGPASSGVVWRWHSGGAVTLGGRGGWFGVCLLSCAFRLASRQRAFVAAAVPSVSCCSLCLCLGLWLGLGARVGAAEQEPRARLQLLVVRPAVRPAVRGCASGL